MLSPQIIARLLNAFRKHVPTRPLALANERRGHEAKSINLIANFESVLKVKIPLPMPQALARR
jgi:hypothetical protein